jgi:rod shape determining protein RodA
VTGEEMSFQEIMSRLNLSSVEKQAVWLVIGVVCMLVVMLINYKFYSKIWIVVLGVSIALLIAVRFFGVVRGGTKGWFAIGKDFTFQPFSFGNIFSRVK